MWQVGKWRRWTLSISGAVVALVRIGHEDRVFAAKGANVNARVASPIQIESKLRLRPVFLGRRIFNGRATMSIAPTAIDKSGATPIAYHRRNVRSGAADNLGSGTTNQSSKCSSGAATVKSTVPSVTATYTQTGGISYQFKCAGVKLTANAPTTWYCYYDRCFTVQGLPDGCSNLYKWTIKNSTKGTTRSVSQSSSSSITSTGGIPSTTTGGTHNTTYPPTSC